MTSLDQTKWTRGGMNWYLLKFGDEADGVFREIYLPLMGLQNGQDQNVKSGFVSLPYKLQRCEHAAVI